MNSLYSRNKSLPPVRSTSVKHPKDFVLDATSKDSSLREYNSLQDPHLRDFFDAKHVQITLFQTGIVIELKLK